jgi:Rad3-related DNA helicase
LGLIGWLLAKWRWSRERTILVLDEGQHIVQEALTIVRDSVSLKTIVKAASEAERYGFGELSDRLRDAAEYYGGLLKSDGEAEAEDKLLTTRSYRSLARRFRRRSLGRTMLQLATC